jgi:hypothetical protein
MGLTLYDVSRYYYVVKRASSVMETRNFSSASRDENASIIFSGFDQTHASKLYSILFAFEFLTPWKTGIHLTRIFEDLPPISQFENEEEVLILPYILFKVVKVTEGTQTEPFSIY